MVMALTLAIQREEIEPANAFIIQDIEYQSLNGVAKLGIETNKRVEYVTYELEDPYRIVIDPLDTVWCDFEDTVYFDKGIIRSIKFVKGREVSEGPGEPYYPFDFVSIELRSPYPYKFSENDYIITLNIGEEKIAQEEIVAQEEIEEKVSPGPPEPIEETSKEVEEASDKKDEVKVYEPVESRPQKDDRVKMAKEPAEKKKEKGRFKQEKELLAKERAKLDLAKKELTKEKKEINITKDELNKKRRLLEKESIRLAKQKTRLKKQKEKLKKKERELKKIKKFDPRPVKDFSGSQPPPPDYLGRQLTLEECIEIAVSNSLPVKIAEERVNLAKLKVNESFRELFPEFNLFWHESSGMITEQLYRGRKVGFEFKQVISHGGEQMYLWEQSKTNLRVAKENSNKAKEEVIFNVTKAYYELAKAINKYDYQKKLLEDVNADFEIVKKEHDLGLMSPLDFMNIESAINQIYHTFITYENTLTLAKLELNKMMNIDIDADIKIDSRLEEKEIDIDLDKCLELALKYKPEYRISYLNSAVAEFAEKIAKSQTFPQVDIFAKYIKAMERLEPIPLPLNKFFENERVLGATVSVPFGPHTIDYQKKRVKLAPTVTTFESDTKYNTDKLRLSFFDDMARYSSVKDASVNYQEALEELNKAERELHANVRESIFSFAEARIKIKNALNNIGLYDRELEVARVKKGLDEITFYELIQAKIKLYTEKGTYTDALGDYYIAVARVNKAVGLGGYFS